MPQYLLLLHSDPTLWQGRSPEEQRAAEQKYMAWLDRPYSRGGKRLANDFGRVVRSHNGTPQATDGPYSETKEHLGGFYVIEAATYDEAVELVKDHPQIEYGGTLEIRQIWGT